MKVTSKSVTIDCERHGKSRLVVKCAACAHEAYKAEERAEINGKLSEFGFATIPADVIEAWTDEQLSDATSWAACRWVWSNDVAPGPMPPLPDVLFPYAPENEKPRSRRA